MKEEDITDAIKEVRRRKEMRIVVDTNVIASAIFFGGKPFELLNLIVKGQVEVFVTPDVSKHIKRTITP